MCFARIERVYTVEINSLMSQIGMKMTGKILLVTLAFAIGVSAQRDAKIELDSDESIIWSADETCDARNSYQGSTAKPQCSRADVNGTVYRILTAKGISLAIAHWGRGNIVLVAVQISNNSGMQLAIDPKNFTIARYKIGTDFLTSDTKPKILASLSPDDAEAHRRAPSDRQRARVANATTSAGVLGGNESRAEVHRGVDNRGRSTAKVVVMPPKRTYPPGNVSVSVSGSGTGTPFETYLQNALLASTLEDKAKTAGYIFFKREQQPRTNIFVFKVGDMTFVFPLESGF